MTEPPADTIGQDVTLEFDGITHPAEIEKIENGWYRCRILVDAAGDYGSITPRLAPQSTVCVRAKNIRPAVTSTNPTKIN